MKPLVANAWSDIVTENSQTFSRISVECTKEPSRIEILATLPKSGRYRATALLHGLGLVMAKDTILIADGLLDTFEVDSGHPVSLVTESPFPVIPTARVVPGMPVRVEFLFSREPLGNLMKDRRIAIDPGHGGSDTGVTGSVNLTEKDCVLTVAKILGSMLEEVGAHPVFTRTGDWYVEEGMRRAILAEESPDLLVSIHMSGLPHPSSRQYRVLAEPGAAQSTRLASAMKKAFHRRMGIPLELYDLEEEALPGVPTVQVEPLCLTNYADEANFRAPLYQSRMARSIFIGIVTYLLGEQNQGD